MPFLLLIVLMTACLPIDWPAPALAWGVAGSAAATAWTAAAVLALAGLITLRTTRRLRKQPGEIQATLQVYAVWRAYHFAGLLAAFAACLMWLGWGWAVRQLATVTLSDGSRLFLPGAELLVVAPFFVMMAGTWWFAYDVERAVHEALPPAGEARPFWGRARYVLFHLRQHALLWLLPLGLLVTQQGLFRVYPESMQGAESRLAVLLVLVLLILVLPLLLRPILGLRPLPPGPTRDRLLAHARRLNFRFRDLLLWDTHGSSANAMVVGFVPLTRYVIFTDRLLAELSPAEVDAVFGHEVGHVRHGHFLFYGAFFVLSMLAFSALWTLLAPPLNTWTDGWVGRYENRLLVLPILLIGVYIFVAFGFLSRRCERQADLFGCLVASADFGGRGLNAAGIETFVSALERVSRLNGMPRPAEAGGGPDPPGARPGRVGTLLRRGLSWLNAWQHSTVPRRVAFLRRLTEDPGLATRFQRGLALIKWGVILGLGGMVVALGYAFGWEVLVEAL